jgi:pimeloyl-ACP methyl ester carboxylesterase
MRAIWPRLNTEVSTHTRSVLHWAEMNFRRASPTVGVEGAVVSGVVVKVVAGPGVHHRGWGPTELLLQDQSHLINCTGSGSPTVVLEHAASASLMLWRRVQPEFSQITRVCSYDRAGHGWSSAREEPRDAKTIVHELHSLLDQAGVKRPFIYVGHSAGGLYVREYAKEYPNELVGVALLEASSPQQIDELPGWRKSWEQDVLDRRRTLWKDRLRQWSGWDRLLGNCQVTVSEQDKPYAGQYRAMQCRPSYVDADESELPDFDTSSKQAAGLRECGRIPLLIISRDPSKNSSASPDDIDSVQVWQQEQENAKHLSPLSWRIIAKGPGHMVPLDRPDLVISQLVSLVDDVRNGDVPNSGTTLTK